MSTINSLEQNIPDDIFDDEKNAAEALREKMEDFMIPGFQVELDPDEAEAIGAFVEDALSEEDAIESSIDMVELPAFLDNDDGLSNDLPPMPTITNAREMFGLRDGETIADAIAREQNTKG